MRLCIICSDAGEVTGLRNYQHPNRSEGHEGVGLQRQSVRPRPSPRTVCGSKAAVDENNNRKPVNVNSFFVTGYVVLNGFVTVHVYSFDSTQIL